MATDQAGDGTENSQYNLPIWVKITFALFIASCIGGFILESWLHAGESLPAGNVNVPTYSSEPVVPLQKPVYRFAVHPLHNPQRLFANFLPVTDIINREAGGDFSVRLIASRDYGFFENRLLKREYDFALANPMQAVWSLDNGYRLVAKMGDDCNFRGIIIGRRDSGIKKPSDLEGSSMVYPSPTALAATLMPRYFLHNRGVNLSSIESTYSGSQESAIMNVYLGKARAAGTWPMPWELFLREKPELGREMKVLWQTEPLVNNALVCRTDLPEEHVRRVVNILLDLNRSPEGLEALKALNLSSFEKVEQAAYAKKVNDFLRNYRKYVSADCPVDGLAQ